MSRQLHRIQCQSDRVMEVVVTSLVPCLPGLLLQAPAHALIFGKFAAEEEKVAQVMSNQLLDEEQARHHWEPHVHTRQSCKANDRVALG